jgi:hypothetical protein
MITGISIENFKGISERVTLDLRPITLLFGANSAGKSTILHALHYAREVFERHNLDADQTIAGGKYIDLGGFDHFLHHGGASQSWNNASSVTLRLDIAVPNLFLPDFDADKDAIGQHLGLDIYTIVRDVNQAAVQITIAWSDLEQCPFVAETTVELNGLPFARISSRPNLREVVVTDIDFSHPCLSTIGDNRTRDTSEATLFDSESILQSLMNQCGDVFHSGGSVILLQGRGDALQYFDVPLRYAHEPFVPQRLDEAALAQVQKNSMAHQAVLILSELILGPCQLVRDGLKQFRYLGPLRDTPARVYNPPRFPNPSRWSSGLGAWDSLHNGPDELVDAVGRWLSDESHLNAGCTLERRTYLELDSADPIIRKLLNRQAFDDIDQDEGLNLSKLPMKTRVVILSGNSEAELRPHDVGIGISQVVPVIVTALDGEDRLLAIEQPELHIHPRLQAAIADLFIESIHKNKHRFIIETHSEHLILRLLRRIRETEKGTAPVDRQLRTDELGIYYLKQENGSTTASRIDVDVNGEFIQPWPDDFFEIDFFERFPDAR